MEPPRDEQWIEQFISELERRHLKIFFRTQVRADRLTEQTALLLKRAGWFATSLGVENWAQSALERMNKTASVENNWEAVQILKKLGIYTQMGMILFDPDTTFQELKINLQALRQLDWPITKGIFTEMFIAPETKISKNLESKGRLGPKQKTGNYVYQVQEEKASMVYAALKKWHKQHADIYDQATNPISAPKILPEHGYREYHRVCMELTLKDLDMFSKFMDQAEQSRLDELFVDEKIRETECFYHDIQTTLSLLDVKYGLNHEVGSNIFLQ